ncbi:MAG: hypothetical protein J6J38_06070 [Lachnospiraceae bacterium]|nr:hypothetical protein [Lachnospiraceae bacterium]
MRKRIGIILCSILVLCALAACKKPSEDDGLKPTATPVLVTQTPMPTGEDIPLTVAPSKTTELPIYTLSGDLTELTAVTALITESEEITEQVVAEAVMEALADSMIYVKVNRVTRKNDIIVVDFDASAPPVSQVGSSIEGLILDAFGQSILDNISDCRGIGFTADGGVYSSGHFEFGENDIYMRR